MDHSKWEQTRSGMKSKYSSQGSPGVISERLCVRSLHSSHMPCSVYFCAQQYVLLRNDAILDYLSSYLTSPHIVRQFSANVKNVSFPYLLATLASSPLVKLEQIPDTRHVLTTSELNGGNVYI